MSDEANFEFNCHVYKQNIPTYCNYFNHQQPLYSCEVKNMAFI